MAKDDDIAISIASVSKRFALPHERQRTVKQMFTSALRGGMGMTPHGQDVRFALRSVDLEIKKGEFFGIVGRNGSGKSTLLKILAGIYQPTHGKVRVSGKLVPFIELGVGFNPELTGRENVALNGALLGFSPKEVQAMYDDVVSFAELEQFMDQKLKNYSSGMQVRLAFSMAVRANADILLIDEVLAVGDAAFQRKCLDYFRRLKKEKRTVVFVSHDMDSVRQFCDRAALIDKSHVIHVGSADDIAEHYARIFIEQAKEGGHGAPEQVKADKRRGSNDVVIENISVNPKLVGDDDAYLEFGGELSIRNDVEKPVIGCRISDGSGKALTGTNSQLLHHDTGSHKAGDRVPFMWRVPNIFSNGSYEIDFAVIDESGKELDIFNRAITFEVMKVSKTPYIITPKLELKFGEEEVSTS